MRHKDFDRLEPVRDRRRLAEQNRIDADQELRVLIGGAPEHDPVDMAQMGARSVEIGQAPVEDDRPVGMGALQLMNEAVIERRDRPVVLGTEALEPGLAGMDDQARPRPPPSRRRQRRTERVSRLLLVDADAALDRDRNIGGRGHRRDAFGDKARARA